MSVKLRPEKKACTNHSVNDGHCMNTKNSKNVARRHLVKPADYLMILFCFSYFGRFFFYLVKKSQLFLWNIDKWIEMLGSHWFGRFGLTVMQKWSWTWNMQSSISMLIRFNWLNIFQFALHVSHMFQGY